MSMKPIEPGCLAIIIGVREYGPIRNGRTVTVRNLWAEIKGHRFWWAQGDGFEAAFHSMNLMRIDGGDESLEVNESREVTV